MDISAPLVVGFVLALVRALAWLFVVPPFGNRNVIPPIATVALAMSLAVAMAPRVGAHAVPLSTPSLIAAVFVEVVSGVLLGFIVQVLIRTVAAAGSAIDLFGGLVLPPAIDPLSTNETPMLGQFYEQVAVVLLFVGNGELLLVDGFVRSFGRGPALPPLGGSAHVLVSDLAAFFTGALEIAAPMLIVLFAAQIVLGMLSRAMPQMNVYWLGFPFQIMLSLLLVGVTVTLLPGYVSSLVDRALHDGALLFGGG